MTTGEDQPQVVVLLAGVGGGAERILLERDQLHVLQRRLETATATQAIDGFVLSRLDQPGAWMLRRALGRPLLERGRERLLHDLFGQRKVAAQGPNQPRRNGS